MKTRKGGRRLEQPHGMARAWSPCPTFLQDPMPEKNDIKWRFCLELLQLLRGSEPRRRGGRDKEMGGGRCKRMREGGGRCSRTLATWLKR